MRNEIFRMSRADALALLERAHSVQLAASNSEGAPVLRTLNFALLDGALVFHGAPAGEKLAIEGRPVVVGASETVAQIPSYFVDPERACPASTLYRSVQVHGVIERVDDLSARTGALAAIMQKYQPEGGYRPLDASDAMYRKIVEGVLVLRVPLRHVDGKAKLGQNRTPQEIRKVLELLWTRGAPGDPPAIEAIRAANPSAPVPPFLEAPEGTALICACDARNESDVLSLLLDTYWNHGVTAAQLLRAHRHTTAWVGARDRRGRLVATARALSDGAKFATLYDVAVAPEWRGRGVGKAVVGLLLAHPLVRGARRARLRTRDATGFYERFGFRTTHQSDSPFGLLLEMERVSPAQAEH